MFESLAWSFVKVHFLLVSFPFSSDLLSNHDDFRYPRVSLKLDKNIWIFFLILTNKCACSFLLKWNTKSNSIEIFYLHIHEYINVSACIYI